MPHGATVIGLILLLLPSSSWAAITGISKTVNFNFGKFSSLTSSGTVTVSAAGARSSSGGVRLLNGGTVAAASFTMTGSANSNYTITLPANNTVVISSGGQTLTLTNFTCSVQLTGKLGGSKTSKTFTVGATATVTPNATPGTYSGTFNVSAN